MPCSSQKVETAPRGASSGHCEIARRTRGSMGSWAATAAASWWKCHHQDDQECHRCPDADSSPMSRDMTMTARPFVELTIPPHEGELDSWGQDSRGQWWGLVTWYEDVVLPKQMGRSAVLPRSGW